MYKLLLFALFYFCCSYWFWFVERGWSHSQESFTASSMLTSPLSSPPCLFSPPLSVYTEASTLQMLSPRSAHQTLTAATHVALARTHLLLSYALCATCFDQFVTLDARRRTENKMLYFSVACFSMKAEIQCVCV